MKNNQKTAVDWQNLSKNDRRKLKKEQKKNKKAKELSRKKLVKWGSILGVVIVVGLVWLGLGQVKEKSYKEAAKIQISPASRNLGQISAALGTVETSFEVKNGGAGKLTISGMESSCGCTTAKLKSKGQESKMVESPEFGMHNNPTDWSIILEVDETAELVVTFDPNFHKNAFGPVTRTVSIFSNDPRNSKKEAVVFINVKK